MTSQPPHVPANHVYTPYYCEENIYLLAQSFQQDSAIVQNWDINVVFVSNEYKTVALWSQKQSTDPNYPVVWDYHCILVLRPRFDLSPNSTWIYDYDSRLTLPSRCQDYVELTFQSELCDLIPAVYRSVFRVIPAAEFIDVFASDRSHMIKGQTDNGEVIYNYPPPTYPPIIARKAREQGISHNLMQSFVGMHAPRTLEGDGDVAAVPVGKDMCDVDFWTWLRQESTGMEDGYPVS